MPPRRPGGGEGPGGPGSGGEEGAGGPGEIDPRWRRVPRREQRRDPEPWQPGMPLPRSGPDDVWDFEDHDALDVPPWMPAVERMDQPRQDGRQLADWEQRQPDEGAQEWISRLAQEYRERDRHEDAVFADFMAGDINQWLQQSGESQAEMFARFAAQARRGGFRERAEYYQQQARDRGAQDPDRPPEWLEARRGQPVDGPGRVMRETYWSAAAGEDPAIAERDARERAARAREIAAAPDPEAAWEAARRLNEREQRELREQAARARLEAASHPSALLPPAASEEQAQSGLRARIGGGVRDAARGVGHGVGGSVRGAANMAGEAAGRAREVAGNLQEARRAAGEAMNERLNEAPRNRAADAWLDAERVRLQEAADDNRSPEPPRIPERWGRLNNEPEDARIDRLLERARQRANEASGEAERVGREGNPAEAARLRQEAAEFRDLAAAYEADLDDDERREGRRGRGIDMSRVPREPVPILQGTQEQWEQLAAERRAQGDEAGAGAYEDFATRAEAQAVPPEAWPEGRGTAAQWQQMAEEARADGRERTARLFENFAQRASAAPEPPEPLSADGSGGPRGGGPGGPGGQGEPEGYRPRQWPEYGPNPLLGMQILDLLDEVQRAQELVQPDRRGNLPESLQSVDYIGIGTDQEREALLSALANELGVDLEEDDTLDEIDRRRHMVRPGGENRSLLWRATIGGARTVSDRRSAVERSVYATDDPNVAIVTIRRANARRNRREGTVGELVRFQAVAIPGGVLTERRQVRGGVEVAISDQLQTFLEQSTWTHDPQGENMGVGVSNVARWREARIAAGAEDLQDHAIDLARRAEVARQQRVAAGLEEEGHHERTQRLAREVDEEQEPARVAQAGLRSLGGPRLVSPERVADMRIIDGWRQLAVRAEGLAEHYREQRTHGQLDPETLRQQYEVIADELEFLGSPRGFQGQTEAGERLLRATTAMQGEYNAQIAAQQQIQEVADAAVQQEQATAEARKQVRQAAADLRAERRQRKENLAAAVEAERRHNEQAIAETNREIDEPRNAEGVDETLRRLFDRADAVLNDADGLAAMSQADARGRRSELRIALARVRSSAIRERMVVAGPDDTTRVEPVIGAVLSGDERQRRTGLADRLNAAGQALSASLDDAPLSRPLSTEAQALDATLGGALSRPPAIERPHSTAIARLVRAAEAQGPFPYSQTGPVTPEQVERLAAAATNARQLSTIRLDLERRDYFEGGKVARDGLPDRKLQARPDHPADQALLDILDARERALTQPAAAQPASAAPAATQAPSGPDNAAAGPAQGQPAAPDTQPPVPPPPDQGQPPAAETEPSPAVQGAAEIGDIIGRTRERRGKRNQQFDAPPQDEQWEIGQLRALLHDVHSTAEANLVGGDIAGRSGDTVVRNADSNLVLQNADSDTETLYNQWADRWYNLRFQERIAEVRQRIKDDRNASVDQIDAAINEIVGILDEAAAGGRDYIRKVDPNRDQGRRNMSRSGFVAYVGPNQHKNNLDYGKELLEYADAAQIELDKRRVSARRRASQGGGGGQQRRRRP